MSLFDEIVGIIRQSKEEISEGKIIGLNEKSNALMIKKYDETIEFIELIQEGLISSEYQYFFLRSENPSFIEGDFLDFVAKNFEIGSFQIKLVLGHYEKLFLLIESLLKKYEENDLTIGGVMPYNSLLNKIQEDILQLKSLGHNGVDLSDEEDDVIEFLLQFLDEIQEIVKSYNKEEDYFKLISLITSKAEEYLSTYDSYSTLVSIFYSDYNNIASGWFEFIEYLKRFKNRFFSWKNI